MLRHIDQQGDVAVRKGRDDEFSAQARQSSDSVRPRLETMPGAVQILFLGLTQSIDFELYQQAVENHPVQGVDVGPRKLSAANTIHGGSVTGTPRVGESLPVGLRSASPGPAPKLHG